MKNLFVPYEISIQLKEKGFNEHCLMCWYKNNKTKLYIGGDERNGEGIIAPLYQQVTDWLRNQHGILAYVDTVIDFSCHTPRLYQKGDTNGHDCPYFEYTDYYDAFNKAITESLKLIP